MPDMFSTDYFSDIIEKALTAFQMPAEPAGLYEPIRYTLDGGGKRLRPVLLLASAKALGIEMFHNFTLLHDDVMDNADVRRGRPTVHRRWNSSTAILSGDAMLTLATGLISDCPDGKLRDTLALFNKTAMEIYEGQQYDMDFESQNRATRFTAMASFSASPSSFRTIISTPMATLRSSVKKSAATLSMRRKLGSGSMPWPSGVLKWLPFSTVSSPTISKSKR